MPRPILSALLISQMESVDMRVSESSHINRDIFVSQGDQEMLRRPERIGDAKQDEGTRRLVNGTTEKEKKAQ